MWTTRRAVGGDVRALAALAQRAYQPYVARIGGSPAPMTADYATLVRDAEIWVCEDSGLVVGLLVLIDGSDHLLLDNVAVSPDYQGKGVGTGLLDLAEERARDLGYAEVRLYTNEHMTENIDYYRRRGYRETHRAVEAGFHRVYFTKITSPAAPG